MDSVITVQPCPNGLLVVIERRKRRTFTLGFDEAAILAAQLQRHLSPVAVTRQESPGQAPELAARSGGPR